MAFLSSICFLLFLGVSRQGEFKNTKTNYRQKETRRSRSRQKRPTDLQLSVVCFLLGAFCPNPKNAPGFILRALWWYVVPHTRRRKKPATRMRIRSLLSSHVAFYLASEGHICASSPKKVRTYHFLNKFLDLPCRNAGYFSAKGRSKTPLNFFFEIRN
jgi:hypothetical protein